MEEHEVELIDYLNLIWRRKYLIIGGTLGAAAAALAVSLLMPKTYEVSRTLKIGLLAGSGRSIEHREAVIDRLKDHRVLRTAMEKFDLEPSYGEMEDLVSIDTKANPGIRYIVHAHDARHASDIADWLAEYIIKVHRPIFDRSMEITKEYEAKLAATIRILDVEIQDMKKVLKRITEGLEVDAPAVILLQANIEGRVRNLASLRTELKGSRLSRLESENTFVIAADAPPKHPIKPRVKLNVMLGGTLGLMMFTFLAFFLEYLQNVRKGGRQK